MKASIRMMNRFLNKKQIKVKALWDKEVSELFQEFRESEKDLWNKPPQGVTLKIFKGWKGRLRISK